jgi:hypothetical protein
MVAGSRIGLALGGLFLLDQPCRWSHHQRLPRFFLGAAAYDRRVGPLDRDLGEPGNGENPADISSERRRHRRVGASSARTKNDRDRAFWLAAELKQLGHTPHIHGWELKGGDDIRNKWQRNSKL